MTERHKQHHSLANGGPIHGGVVSKLDGRHVGHKVRPASDCAQPRCLVQSYGLLVALFYLDVHVSPQRQRYYLIRHHRCRPKARRAAEGGRYPDGQPFQSREHLGENPAHRKVCVIYSANTTASMPQQALVK